jgi:hypothetical protein
VVLVAGDWRRDPARDRDPGFSGPVSEPGVDPGLTRGASCRSTGPREPVAQLVEHETFNLGAQGSSPCGLTKTFQGLIRLFCPSGKESTAPNRRKKKMRLCPPFLPSTLFSIQDPLKRATGTSAGLHRSPDTPGRRGTGGLVASCRRDSAATAADAHDPGGTHRPRDALASVPIAPGPKRRVHARHTVCLTGPEVDRPHRLHDQFVARRARGRRPSEPCGVPGFRNAQHAGHDRNRKIGPVRIPWRALRAIARRVPDQPSGGGSQGRQRIVFSA